MDIKCLEEQNIIVISAKEQEQKKEQGAREEQEERTTQEVRKEQGRRKEQGHRKNEEVSRRYGNLVQLLNLVKGFPSWSLEEIFFSGMIENVRIDSVIPFILKMNVPTKPEPKEEPTLHF